MNLKKINKRIFIILIVIIMLIGIILLSGIPNKLLKAMYPMKYEEHVSKYANEYGIDEFLVYAVIKAESNFDEKATSSKGAKGIMQLMESTAKDVAKKANIEIAQNEIEEKLLQVETNIQLGTKYLAILLEKYENTEVALTAYNAGIGTVDNWIEKGIISADGSNIENIPYKETNNYVRQILRDYRIYCELYK